MRIAPRLIKFSKWTSMIFVAFLIFMYFFSKTDTFFYLTEKILFNHEYLTPAQAEKKWDRVPFDSAKFRAKTNRKEMAVDIVRNRILIGLSREEIINLLGKGDGGYYITEGILTYRLFVSQKPNGPAIEAYSLLVLRSNLSDPQSRVDSVYIWKDW